MRPLESLRNPTLNQRIGGLIDAIQVSTNATTMVPAVDPNFMMMMQMMQSQTSQLIAQQQAQFMAVMGTILPSKRTKKKKKDETSEDDDSESEREKNKRKKDDSIDNVSSESPILMILIETSMHQYTIFKSEALNILNGPVAVE